MMNKEQEYIIGRGKAPAWCSRWLTPYLKESGLIGYEYHGKHRDYDLNVGDKLIFKDGRIYVRRGAAR